MAFTQADVDALKGAMAAAGNAKDVAFSDGSRVSYISPGEAAVLLETMMRDVRAAAAADAVAAGAPAPSVRAFRGYVRSGY